MVHAVICIVLSKATGRELGRVEVVGAGALSVAVRVHPLAGRRRVTVSGPVVFLKETFAGHVPGRACCVGDSASSSTIELDTSLHAHRVAFERASGERAREHRPVRFEPKARVHVGSALGRLALAAADVLLANLLTDTRLAYADRHWDWDWEVASPRA